MRHDSDIRARSARPSGASAGSEAPRGFAARREGSCAPSSNEGGFTFLEIMVVMGIIAGPLCLWGVSGLKRLLGVDDVCDVFGVHGVGGILGAILTGVFCAKGLGGIEPDGYNMAHQVWVQVKSVLVTVVWSGAVSFVAFKLASLTVGLRVTEESERQGLDITSHGEVAYTR